MKIPDFIQHKSWYPVGRERLQRLTHHPWWGRGKSQLEHWTSMSHSTSQPGASHLAAPSQDLLWSTVIFSVLTPPPVQALPHRRHSQQLVQLIVATQNKRRTDNAAYSKGTGSSERSHAALKEILPIPSFATTMHHLQVLLRGSQQVVRLELVTNAANGTTPNTCNYGKKASKNVSLGDEVKQAIYLALAAWPAFAGTKRIPNGKWNWMLILVLSPLARKWRKTVRKENRF